MEKNELAFAKQALLATRDWDTYQAIIRKCLRIPGKSMELKQESDKL